ncbi:MAG: hypothetical protein LAT54_02280 [Cryomorphaceae bacterium]|nr:hypothetical protein [Cryomorphaceae bacterium]
MRKVFVGIFFFLVFSSCENDNDFSDVPFLEYVSHEFKVKDEQRFIEMKLYFNDRDGNIGLEPWDTAAPFNQGSEYFNNLWVTAYLIRDGAPSDTFFGFDGRIPNLTPEGQNKSLEGNIFYDMPIDGLAIGDTMIYDFILVDRDLNKSDTATTPPIRIEQ